VSAGSWLFTGPASARAGVRPPPSGDLTTWPRRGASLYALLTDSAWDYEGFADILADCGLTLTRVFLLTAEWKEQRNDIVWPFQQLEDGRWDLFAWNPAYFNRLADVVAAMNARGVLVQLTVMELYGWSDRKQGSGMPDAEQGPWRRNVNGIRWATDRTFVELPDAWLNAFIDRVVATVKGMGVVWEIGNEMPEKPMHHRIRDRIRQTWPDAQTSVNRNEDVPGQYKNMKIGTEFDRLAIHGMRTLAHLDRKSGTRGDESFRRLIDQVDPARLIFSSDGCRQSGPAGMDPATAYDWPALLEVARYVTARGCSYEHQSAAKLERIRSGRADLGAVEVDFLKQLAAL
jgi:hypothetical protein